ncbi:MAG: hypothetical protein Q8P49_02865 [Candidatus Liptonbacteria bacterium]|nr:hypothetical protein [Candidatus Liptonbacteria bacterium]
MTNRFETMGASQGTAPREKESSQLLEEREKELLLLTQEIDALQKKRDRLSNEIDGLRKNLSVSERENSSREIAEELKRQGLNLEIGSEVTAANPLYPGRKDKATITGFNKDQGVIYAEVDFPHGGRGGIPMSTRILLSDIESAK